MQWTSIKSRVEAIPKHKSPSHSTAYFSLIFLSILACLELHFLSIWLPLGSVLDPFWSSLASIWPPWRRLGRVARNVHEFPGFWSPFWFRFGTILAPKTDLFPCTNCIDFFINFWSHFGSILGAFFSSFLLPKSCQNRKRRFCENELLVYTRCSFSRIQAPKIHPKINEKSIKK